MVRKRVRQMYVDEDFYNLTNVFKAEIQRNTGKRVGNPDITRDIKEFLENEKLVPIMLKRVKNKRRFFL